jgi:hypothetical protein
MNGRSGMENSPSWSVWTPKQTLRILPFSIASYHLVFLSIESEAMLGKKNDLSGFAGKIVDGEE